MTKLIQVMAFVCLSLFTPSIFAQVFLEPELGFETMDFEQKAVSGATNSLSDKGLSVSLRGGYQAQNGWGFGLFFNSASFTSELEDSFQATGVFGQYQWPDVVKIRLNLGQAKLKDADQTFSHGEWAVEWLGLPVHLGLSFVVRQTTIEDSLLKEASTFGIKPFVSYFIAF